MDHVSILEALDEGDEGYEKCAGRWPAHSEDREVGYFLAGRLAGRVRGAGEDGVVAAGAREQDGEADGGEHEDDRRVGGELGEEVGGAAGAEGGLRTLAAEGSGEVGGLALLEEDDADEEEADDDMNDDEKNDHRGCLLPLRFRECPENVWIGAAEDLSGVPRNTVTNLTFSVSLGIDGPKRLKDPWVGQSFR